MQMIFDEFQALCQVSDKLIVDHEIFWKALYCSHNKEYMQQGRQHRECCRKMLEATFELIFL